MVPIEASPSSPQPIEQARAILERERPSAGQERLFQILNWLLLGALGMTALYVALSSLGVSAERAQLVLQVAFALGLASPFVALANLRLWRRVLRADRLARQWNPSWRESLRNRGGRGLLSTTAVVLRVAIGLLFVLLGWLGVAVESGFLGPVEELLDREPSLLRLALAFTTTAFGFSAILQSLVVRARARLDAIAELRASVTQGVLTPAAHDIAARLDREGLEAKRERVVRAESKRADATRYRYQESAAVRAAKEALPSEVLVEVLSYIDRLITKPNIAHESSGRLQYDAISGTNLELGYSIDRTTRTVLFISLTPTGHHRPEADTRTEAGLTGYRIDLAPSALASYARLTPPQRRAVDTLIGDVAEDPSAQRRLASTAVGNTLVRRDPIPSVDVTYQVDDARKSVTVLHSSAPISPRRNVFISYCHEDGDTCEKVRKRLRALEREGLLDVWGDHLIKAGERWSDKIGGALDKAQAALLLVSEDFLDSDFIRNVELPMLLERESRGLTRIFWIPVRKSSVFSSRPDIAAFESLLKPPDTSLQDHEDAGKSRGDQALLQIYERLRDALTG